jgi:hypothetical protein
MLAESLDVEINGLPASTPRPIRQPRVAASSSTTTQTEFVLLRLPQRQREVKDQDEQPEAPQD